MNQIRSGGRSTTCIRLRHKILYGMGYLSVALTTDVTLTWLLKCYRPDPLDVRWKVLVSGAGFAAAVLLGRVVDALADPLVGYWSDRVRTRLGRRKPFILVGAPLLALLFVLIWTPPTPGISAANAIYLGATASAFFFVFTIVVCPYLAMLPDITRDRTERVSLTAWQAAFNVVGAVGGMALVGYLIEHYGYRTMAVSLSPVILFCSWAPLLVPQTAASARPSTLVLPSALRRTLQNPLFLPYVLAQLCFWIAVRMTLLVLPKLLGVRAQVAETKIGLVMAAGLLVAALLLPFMPRCARRVGKKRLLIGSMLYFGLLMLPLPFIGDLPLALSPLGQAFLLMACAGPAVAVLFTLPNAIVADIVDRDETSTGERREAIYFGVQGLIVKFGMGVGGAMAAVLLERFGETASGQGGFLACSLAAMTISCLAAAVMTRYRDR